MVSSIASRVVPGISDTMALSSFNRTFNRVDFPTFGSPIIATGIPFFIAFPSSKDPAIELNVSRISFSRLFNRTLSANSTSSSLKSSSSSIKEIKFRSLSRNCRIWFENPPLICLSATFREASEVDDIKSATASACERSSFPFRKALMVNSPGFANLAPDWIRMWRIFFCTTTEP